MNIDELNNEYFEWIYNLCCDDLFSEHISYRKLFMYLHNTEFTYSIRKDQNRAADGIDLRQRFSLDSGFDIDYLSSYLDGPCSVLEMIFALALKCEETIMDNPKKGDRTKQWFWGMINNLGLGGMDDSNFDKKYVVKTIDTFLKRRYSPDGRGGLFTIRNCDEDLRNVEIWCQLCWYLDSIT